MNLEIRSSCPKVLLINEQIKGCRGCLVYSQNREGRAESRSWMKVHDEEWNQKKGIEKVWVSVRDLGYDDMNQHLFKIHVKVLHEDDHPDCYNYSIRRVSDIKEVMY